MQYSTLFLLPPSWIRWIHWLSENYPAPFCANAFSNTDFTVSQWYVPSCSRSSWSWWRIIFVTFLHTCVDKYSPREGLASIVIYFLSPVGMTVWTKTNRIAETVRTRFLDAFRSTSFLNVIGSSFHTKFFRVWFLKGWYLTSQRFEAQDVFSHPVSSCTCWRRYQEL